MLKQILELLMQNNYNVFVYNGIDIAFEGQITGVGEHDFNVQGQCTATKEHSVKTFIIPRIGHLKTWNEEMKEATVQVY